MRQKSRRLWRGDGDVDPRLAFLPPDRQKSIRDVESRFREGLIQVLNGHEPPGCDDPFVCLREQREAALAQLLTPDEREQYELHFSPTAEALREQLQGIAVTESEFRLVFQLRRELDQRFPSHPLDFLNSDRLQARQQVEAQIEEEVRRILGPERYQQFKRSQS